MTASDSAASSEERRLFPPFAVRTVTPVFHRPRRHRTRRRRLRPAGSALAVAAAGVLFVVVPHVALAQRATLERLTQQRTLDNGLQVIVVENHAVPLATAEVVVRAGAITQEPDDQGVPHLFEHMLFKSYHGSAGRTFGQAAGLLQAGYNGATDDESVSYFLTLPSSRLDAGVGLLADLLRGPRFSETELRAERQVVFGEYERDMADPRFQLHRELTRRLWGQAFYRKNTIGEVAALERVKARRLDSIYRRLYVPNNAALVVTGDVSPEAVFALARQRFGAWKRGPDPFAGRPAPAIPPLDSSRALVLMGDVPDVTVEMMWQGPSVGADPAGTYAADVLADVVDDDQSAFQRRLVESGLFTHASLGYQTLDHVGPITLVATTTLPKLSAALTVLSAELREMTRPDYFTAEELAVAKQRRAVRTAFALEAGPSLAQTVGFWWSVAGTEYYFGYVDNMSTRTPADLNAFVTRYLAGRPFVVGALAPKADAPQVSAWLTEYIGYVEGK